MKRLWEGFLFGMVLQIAVGPVCLTVFSLGTSYGFWQAWLGSLGAVTADILFVTFALVGVGALMKNEKIEKGFRWFGALLIFLFGAELVLNPFGISFFPKISNGTFGNAPFLRILLLTLSNPIAILFWIGVFSVKIGEIQEGVYAFAIGAVLATLFFLTLVSFAAGLTHSFLPQRALDAINILAGLILMFFGVTRLIPQKTKN